MATSTKAAAPKVAPPPGNLFEYWVPKGASGKPPLPPPPPAPAAPAPGAVPGPKTKKAPADTPKGYVEDKFQLATHVPFGSGGKIGLQYAVVTQTKLLVAAVECGYGPQAYWTAKLLLSPSAGSDLARHLLLRLEWIRSATNSPTSPLTMSDFYERIEASEKLTVSFTLGSLFTYLSAELWLKSAGETLISFLHTGLYTAALGTAATGIPWLATSKKLRIPVPLTASAGLH